MSYALGTPFLKGVADFSFEVPVSLSRDLVAVIGLTL